MVFFVKGNSSAVLDWVKKHNATALLCRLCVGVCLMLSGCADSVTFTEAATREPVGFWYGLWHGLIIEFSFVVSLFSDSTAIYATYNNGGWYDFGFLIGASSALAGKSSAASSSNDKSQQDHEQ